jgi:hypothetical protein
MVDNVPARTGHQRGNLVGQYAIQGSAFFIPYPFFLRQARLNYKQCCYTEMIGLFRRCMRPEEHQSGIPLVSEECGTARARLGFLTAASPPETCMSKVGVYLMHLHEHSDSVGWDPGKTEMVLWKGISARRNCL